MRSPKRYSNVTFTKRVDHDGGRHRPPRAPKEPRVCQRCGARYARRRWTDGRTIPRSREAPERTRGRVLCPACIQTIAGPPSGFLRVSGAFLRDHHDDVVAVLRIEARRAAEDNPLARIMSWRDLWSRIEVTTTTPHLVQRLGHKLQKAYGGTVKYDFSHENQVARVTWSRPHRGAARR